MLSCVILCYPLLSCVILCYPVLSFVNLCYPVLSSVILCCVSSVILCYPLLTCVSSVILCYPLLTCYPVLSFVTSVNLLFCQVLMLRLLRVVLPAWEIKQNVKQQERLIGQLFTLLGEVLVLCSSPFVRPSRTGQTSRSLS